MLTQIREKIVGPIGLVVLGAIALSFVFFGASLNFAGNVYAAKVDGSEIGINQFENVYRQQLDANPQLAMLPPEFRAQYRQSIVESLIRDRLVELHLVEAGYQISEAQLTAAIQRVPEFLVDGKFDLDSAETLLAQNGLTTASFRNIQRNQLRLDQLRRAIGGTSLVTPSDYRRYLNLVTEQRLVSIATFDLASAAAEFEISEEEIAAYYTENDSLYLLPEVASIEYIEINRDDVAASIEISDEILNEYYLDSQSRYMQDEQRRARHILILSGDDEVAAEATAQDLLARIEAGESFEELASENSADGTTATQGGDLGVRTRAQLSDEVGSAVFTMVEGELTGPIKSEFGFHIVRLDEVLEQGPLPLDDVRGELLSELRDRETEGLYRDMARTASDALFETSDMQTIADAVELYVRTADGVQRTDAGPFGSNQAAIDAIFSDSVLLDGEVSEVIELDATRSAIFKVVAHEDASRRSLDAVREDVSVAIRSIAAEAIIFERAALLMQALENGEDFGIAAESAGATVLPTALIGRQNNQIDPNVMAEIFASAKPSDDAPVHIQVADQIGGQAVVSLEAVLPGRPESIPLADRDAGKEQLTQQSGGAEFSAFVEALYRDADIVINQDVVAASDLLQ
jgi:peptidyl-prolyl cis-trans isomerase D